MAAERPRFVTSWGLHVKDDAGYTRYREAMTPILTRYGGAFGYDLVVGEVKRSEAPHPVNRVFTIRFPDRGTEAGFFADPEYRSVRSRYFEASVGGVTKIGEWEDSS
jgi:uncharacterized protein (DUF1330 family)